jgi:3-hydroxyacyl-[acyl-carrier-protein] dehydratase
VSAEDRILTPDQIRGFIPHRDPILYLASAEILEPGVRATGRLVDIGDSRFGYLEGHFPGFRLFPGFFLAESLAQLLSVAARSEEQKENGLLGVLTSADRLRFRGMVRPGDSVDLEAEVTKIRRINRGEVRAVGSGQVAARIEGKMVCEGEIGFTVIVDPRSQV